MIAPGPALGPHMSDGRFDGYDRPRLIAPQTPPQVLRVGHGTAVQERTLHERRGVLQRSGFTGGQPRQTSVQTERRPLVETEISVGSSCLVLLPASVHNNNITVVFNRRSKRKTLKASLFLIFRTFCVPCTRTSRQLWLP